MEESSYILRFCRWFNQTMRNTKQVCVHESMLLSLEVIRSWVFHNIDLRQNVAVRSSCDVCPTINTPRLKFISPHSSTWESHPKLHFSQEVNMIGSFLGKTLLLLLPQWERRIHCVCVCFSNNFEKSQHTHTDEHEHKTNQMNPTVERQTYNKIFHPFPDPAAFLTFWGNSYSNSQAKEASSQKQMARKYPRPYNKVGENTHTHTHSWAQENIIWFCFRAKAIMF